MLQNAAFFLIFALMSTEPDIGYRNASPINTETLLQEIKEIADEDNQKQREKRTEEMSGDVFAVWKSGRIETLDTNVVTHLIPLLDDNSDIVRGWAACAIGYFGSRAKVAAPHLRAAEDREIEEVISLAKARGEKTVMAPAYDSTACIDRALSQIDNDPH
jgi:hypothetical protein